LDLLCIATAITFGASSAIRHERYSWLGILAAGMVLFPFALKLIVTIHAGMEAAGPDARIPIAAVGSGD
jgi:hypothetical protein